MEDLHNNGRPPGTLPKHTDNINPGCHWRVDGSLTLSILSISQFDETASILLKLVDFLHDVLRIPPSKANISINQDDLAGATVVIGGWTEQLTSCGFLGRQSRLSRS